ncbi:MAG: hypothetical protein WDA27_10405 [Actinomycetota bacterium]
MEVDRVTAFLLFAVLLIGAAPLLLFVMWIGRKIARRGGKEQANPAGKSIASVLLVATALAALGGAVFLLTGKTTASTNPHTGHSDPSEALMQALPRTLAGQSLADLSTGEDALQQVGRMHGKNLEITGAIVATYGASKDGATLWIASVGSASAARTMRDQMVKGMTQSKTPFETPWKVPGEDEVWATADARQAHYFFASGLTVWWVASDKSNAVAALADTLKAAGIRT